jgi:hypothetical protein
VTGSAAGLATAGGLAGPLGVGPAIALLALFPLLGAALIALRFPETRGRSLEETSGDTVPVPVELL